MTYKIINEDINKWSEDYDGELFHAVFCDAPYHLTTITKRFGKEGSAPAKFGTDGAFGRVAKGFMGQEWDGGDVAFRPETWAGMKKHLYPGAFGMTFGGSRTAHRIAVAIEDAGFIIHPQIAWVQSQGFPKATRVKGYSDFDGHRYGLQALKPSHEPIILFSNSKGLWYNNLQKQLIQTTEILEIIWNQFVSNAEEISKAAWEVNIALSNVLNFPDQNSMVGGLNVETVEKLSIKPLPPSKTVERKETSTTAQGNVTLPTDKNSLQEPANSVGNISEQKIPGKLENIVVQNVVMPPKNAPCWMTPYEMGIDTNTIADILQSNLEKVKLDLSMIWLWRLILVDICEKANKSTIETGEKMIIELSILNYSLHKLMQKCQTTPFQRNLSGELLYVVQDVVRSFIGLSTFPMGQTPDVQGVVNPIIVFQKPFEGKPVENIVANGAGTLSIDGGRIPLEQGESYDINRFTNGAKPFGDAVGEEYETIEETHGRWPSNFIIDDTVSNILDAQSGHLKSGKMSPEISKRSTNGSPNGIYGKFDVDAPLQETYGDSGGASRFFFNVQINFDEADPFVYEKKVSQKERNAGMSDEKNTHPTLKSISLTKYLSTLLLPPAEYAPRRLLVPFSGVASEIIGSLLAGWEYVEGVELTPEYIPIAHKRLEHWIK